MPKTLLALENASMGPPENRLFTRLSFTIAGPGLCGLYLPKKGGKTTLFAVIAGLLPLTGGTITRNYQRLGLVPQDFALYPDLTVTETLAFMAGLYGLGEPLSGQRSALVVAACGLSNQVSVRAGQLVAGRRKMLELAVALLVWPDFLLLDEPAAGMTGPEREVFWQVVYAWLAGTEHFAGQAGTSSPEAARTALLLSADQEEISRCHTVVMDGR
ncbi:MAG: ATP-binding cassette domain-containing protein [Heliobacteriaceae bacterium]|nr:ATP-binding cassette domain-containing protein [Heliobacteriaceae bacterium]MDD4587697.1 ATP-binding cassette domain-containing protein [Heliobacteriaceae bacterium]